MTRRRLPLRAHITVFAVVALCVSAGVATEARASQPSPVQIWLTDPSTSTDLAQQSSLSWTSGTSSAPDTITTDPNTTYQSIVGIGASMTDSSAYLIHTDLNSSQQNALMTALFSPTNGIGISMLRQPFGASDFTASGPYTYDDMPIGQTDPTLANFSIAHDQSYIIPLLQQALSIDPGLTVLATPWSPPGWMRRGDNTIGTTGLDLLPQYYSAWAQYLVKSIQAYQAAGIPISYLTPQNEPTNNALDYPGMQIGESDMANLIANYLGPAMANAGLSTKLLGWDFTWDNETYPEQLLSDPTVAQYLAGTAWHCYAGDPSAMTDVHDFAPSKDNFETECSGLISNGAGEPVRTDATQFSDTMNLFINSTRNWARSVILWNIALNQLGGPTIGCLTCRPLVTITFNPLNLFTNPWDWTPAIEYYAMGQTAKFVRPGAVRIDSSTDATGINDAAFVNTDGSKVLVATNNGSSAQTFSVQWGGQYFSYTLNPGAAATFTWTDS